MSLSSVHDTPRTLEQKAQEAVAAFAGERFQLFLGLTPSAMVVG